MISGEGIVSCGDPARQDKFLHIPLQTGVVPRPERAPERENSLQGTGGGTGKPNEHPPLEKARGEREREGGGGGERYIVK